MQVFNFDVAPHLFQILGSQSHAGLSGGWMLAIWIVLVLTDRMQPHQVQGRGMDLTSRRTAVASEWAADSRRGFQCQPAQQPALATVEA